MRHRPTANSSALASVRNTLSLRLRKFSFCELDDDVPSSSCVELDVALALPSNDVPLLPSVAVLLGVKLSVFRPFPRQALRAFSANVPAAKPTASCPNPNTLATGEEGTATSRRFTGGFFSVSFFVGLGASAKAGLTSAAAAGDDASRKEDRYEVEVVSVSVVSRWFTGAVTCEDTCVLPCFTASSPVDLTFATVGLTFSHTVWLATAGTARRRMTPPVTTISASAAISFDASGPRDASPVRATPRTPRAKRPNEETRSDIA
mmetsp:Transcript_6183/g.20709  ORF Transcript_6183/g.20709 Transcript_6183/m.20709 type:complete len:262 (-) Transcript_6183:34-819(-)